jgi:uncharacterized protein YebE (UPF0316 family)
MPFYDTHIFTYLILPLLIILARICDVTIGTMRIIVLSRGHKYLAPMLGFFEVLVWITVMAKIMQNMHNPICYIAYACGFALGNFVGIVVEERIAIGNAIIRIITPHDAAELIKSLRDSGYGVTIVPAQGSTGMVHLIYTVVKRGHLEEVEEMIRNFNPHAFYSIEDVRYVSEGVFPRGLPFYKQRLFGLPEMFIKDKRRQDNV